MRRHVHSVCARALRLQRVGPQRWLWLMLAVWSPAELAWASKPNVQASVEWQGVCENPTELARETRLRGVELVRPPGPASLAPSKSQQESVSGEGVASSTVRVQVRVAERQGPLPLAAELELEDALGARENRNVDARSCGELRQGVAWILVTLANEGRVEPRATAASSAPVAFPELETGSRGAADQSKPGIPAPSPANYQLPKAAHVKVNSSAGRAAGRAQTRLGFALGSGVGFSERAALGPTIYMDHALSPRLSLRLSAFQLSTVPFRAGEATLSIDRLGTRFGVHLTPWSVPFAFGLSAEAGRLIAAGSELRVSRTDVASWFALDVSALWRAPLLRRRLWLEAGLGGAYTPFTYRFEYGSGELVSQAEPFEARLQAGLSVQL